MTEDLLIKISNITIKHPDLKILPDTSLDILKGKNYLVTGDNGCGKTSLMRVVKGDISVCKGSILRFHDLPVSQNIAYISFENQKKIINKEKIKEEAEYYSNKVQKNKISDLIDDFIIDDNSNPLLNLNKLKNSKISDLSSGELRRFEILKELKKNPQILILDEPFDGLDFNSKKSLKNLIESLIDSDLTIFLVTHRISEIIGNKFFHIHIKDNKVSLYNSINLNKDIKNSFFPNLDDFDINYQPSKFNKIFEIENGSVSYGDKLIFDDLNLTIKSGEKWLIKGENGCGKSTLIKLITGDHLQSYSNKIKIFDKKRGSGESIWEIKKHLGYISSAIHLDYDKNIESYKVVASGFYDSIGLYKNISSKKEDMIKYVFDKLFLKDLYFKNFKTLSYGQQRIILILRALIKNPELIIMDEPCHGLDGYNRELVLKIVESICKLKNKTLIYTTHSNEETSFKYTNLLEFLRHYNKDIFQPIIRKIE